MIKIIHSAEEFDKLIADNDVVLVDFWATWCGPCRIMLPTVEEIAGETDGKFAVAKVDVDENEDLAKRFRIMTIPTLIYFKGGAVAEQSVGVRTKGQILATVEKYL